MLLSRLHDESSDVAVMSEFVKSDKNSLRLLQSDADDGFKRLQVLLSVLFIYFFSTQDVQEIVRAI